MSKGIHESDIVSAPRNALVVTWPQLGVTVLVLVVVILTAIWQLVGARTRYVLNEDFWASDRIRPSMKLYILENTVSRDEFSRLSSKFDSVGTALSAQLRDISMKVDYHMIQSGNGEKK